jgi:hypothetical protein
MRRMTMAGFHGRQVIQRPREIKVPKGNRRSHKAAAAAMTSTGGKNSSMKVSRRIGIT